LLNLHLLDEINAETFGAQSQEFRDRITKLSWKLESQDLNRAEMAEYPNSRQARQDIASYLAYYNLDRRHSSLNYLTPAAFETQLNQSI
jgi:transposase InsO family protein